MDLNGVPKLFTRGQSAADPNAGGLLTEFGLGLAKAANLGYRIASVAALTK